MLAFFSLIFSISPIKLCLPCFPQAHDPFCIFLASVVTPSYIFTFEDLELPSLQFPLELAAWWQNMWRFSFWVLVKSLKIFFVIPLVYLQSLWWLFLHFSEYSIMYRSHIFIILSSVERLLSCFHFLVTMNRTSIGHC